LIAIVWLIGTGNYLVTAAGVGAVVLAGAGGLALGHLRLGRPLVSVELASGLAGAAPWLAWMGLALRRVPATSADRDWQLFRDRFGAIWALRLAEQFNRAAANGGWPTRLGWFGLEPRGGTGAAEWTDALAALQRRFRVSDPGGGGR
jgi:hypothetical protein